MIRLGIYLWVPGSVKVLQILVNNQNWYPSTQLPGFLEAKIAIFTTPGQPITVLGPDDNDDNNDNDDNDDDDDDDGNDDDDDLIEFHPLPPRQLT